MKIDTLMQKEHFPILWYLIKIQSRIMIGDFDLSPICHITTNQN